MNIHEYQAKQLFERFGVATPKGIAAATAQEAAQTARNMGLSQYVVKAQVHAGGRGKGTFKNGFKGGVHVVKSVEEVEEVAGKMLNQVLVTKQTGETGKLVSKIMVAEAVDLKKECYFAILQDRARECPVIVASTEGGMDIEETYQLIDTYTQECEKLQSEDAVKNLQYNMTMDFANRVAMQKSPRTISADTKQCLQYITTHINQPIGVSDVVAHSSHSRSSLLRHFKEETGMSVNDYITLRRMKEAASLLRYTDKSLGEISSYLCFSSQSYFQNVFKKHYGITPLQYRNQRA